MKSQQVSTSAGQVPNAASRFPSYSLRKTLLEVQPADVARAQGVQVLILHLAIDHMEATAVQNIDQATSATLEASEAAAEHGFAEKHSPQ